jgi:enamine deaminase RidA (YjgF/YER057c/UK114 family)
MSKQTVNPSSLFNSLQYGFSQITIGQGSRIVTVSGQVGWDTNEVLIAQDFAGQTDAAFANLDVAMREAGGTLTDILSLRIYIVADQMDDMNAVSAALKKYFPNDPPTTNWIGVVRLARRELLIEAEALAVLD